MSYQRMPWALAIAHKDLPSPLILSLFLSPVEFLNLGLYRPSAPTLQVIVMGAGIFYCHSDWEVLFAFSGLGSECQSACDA